MKPISRREFGFGFGFDVGSVRRRCVPLSTSRDAPLRTSAKRDARRCVPPRRRARRFLVPNGGHQQMSAVVVVATTPREHDARRAAQRGESGRGPGHDQPDLLHEDRIVQVEQPERRDDHLASAGSEQSRTHTRAATASARPTARAARRGASAGGWGLASVPPRDNRRRRRLASRATTTTARGGGGDDGGAATTSAAKKSSTDDDDKHGRATTTTAAAARRAQRCRRLLARARTHREHREADRDDDAVAERRVGRVVVRAALARRVDAVEAARGPREGRRRRYFTGCPA